MARNGSGIYSLPTYLAETGQTILAARHNGPLEDIAAEITASLPRAGTAAMTGALAMGANKITGLADATLATDAVNRQLGDSRYILASGGEVETADIADANVTYAKMASAAIATAANIRASAASVLVTPDGIESSSAAVVLTDAATVAVDWDTGINFSLTLGGNRTLGFPTNVQPGTWRRLEVTQDGTGTRTLAFTATGYYSGGGNAPVLSVGAADVDVFYLYGRTTSIVEVYVGAVDLVQIA